MNSTKLIFLGNSFVYFLVFKLLHLVLHVIVMEAQFETLT